MISIRIFSLALHSARYKLKWLATPCIEHRPVAEFLCNAIKNTYFKNI
jgi:hypothetical protein